MVLANAAEQESCECCCKFLANAAAKLRIRKESDFNITEFFRMICVFLGNKSCDFIRIDYLCII